VTEDTLSWDEEHWDEVLQPVLERVIEWNMPLKLTQWEPAEKGIDQLIADLLKFKSFMLAVKNYRETHDDHRTAPDPA
jgi:hypothetical protein